MAIKHGPNVGTMEKMMQCKNNDFGINSPLIYGQSARENLFKFF
jgi:hypothetical protein